MKKLPSDVRKASVQIRNRFRLLMTGALDGELSSEEECEFKSFLSASSACRREWNAYKTLSRVIRQIKFTQPPEEAWNRYWDDVCNRIEGGA